MEEKLVTQTHDGSPKLWQVWVRYKDKIQARRLGKPQPQDKAMNQVEKLNAKECVAEAWCEEEL